MIDRRLFAFAVAMCFTAVCPGLFNPVEAGSVTFEILADTSGLTPGPGGLIDISLNPAFPPGSASVSASVFDPTTDGTLGAATPISGTATGDLTTPGGVSANNTQSANELTQNVTVGSFFDVFVTLSGSEVGPGAVGPFSGTVFSLIVFDSGTGHVAVQLTVNPNVGANGNPIIDGTVGIMTSGPQVMVNQQSSVPEPSSVSLLSLGLGAVVVISRRRKRRARRD
jgi:PEP-CTERM motif